MEVRIPRKSALATQLDVIWALYIRETSTRFGVYKLGLVWAVLEPLTSTIVLGLLLGVVLQRTVPNIPYPLFVLAGFVPFRLLTNSVTASVSALGSNQGLLVYRQVTPLDPFLARLLLEVVFSIASFTLFIVMTSWFGIVPDFVRPLEMLFAFFSLLMVSAGLAILTGVYARRHPEVQKVIPFLIRPLFYSSCIIFPLGSIPPRFQKILLYNPLCVIVESIRDGMFADYSRVELSLAYPFAWGVCLLAAGLAYYRRERMLLHEGSRT